jgi:hypothetical protein
MLFVKFKRGSIWTAIGYCMQNPKPYTQASMTKVTHNSIPPLNSLFLAPHIKTQFYLTFHRSMGNKKPQHVFLDFLLHNSNCNWSLTESMQVMHKFSGMLHNIGCSAPLMLLPYLGSFSSCIHGKSCLTSTFWNFSTRLDF